MQYRNPKDSSQEWSGRGRQPNWVKEFVASGADLQTAKVKA
jgi:DNA-binding protein H-NS